jgi:hypothetical protein
MPTNRDEPKTRKEKKGRDKIKPNIVYSAKHVREQERLMEKRNKSNKQPEQANR